MIEGQYDQTLVNTLYPDAFMFDAMKIWTLPENKKHKLQEICEGGEYFAQIKTDGNWYQFVTAPTESYLFSRSESVVTNLLTEKLANVPHIKEALKRLPPNTIVIGEIYYPGLTSNEVRSIMGCKAPLAIARQKGAMGFIKYYLHDIIMFNGVNLMNMGAWDRYCFLKAAFEKLDLGNGGSVELAESFETNIYEKIFEALESGEEGMVLKRRDYKYIPAKKPAWSAIKVKKVDYADVICMSLEPATKKYDGEELDTWRFWESETGATYDLDRKGWTESSEKLIENGFIPITKSHYFGWCGSISIGVYDVHGELKKIGSVSSGLTDALKESMKQKPENYIGQVCECKLMQKFEQAFRHGVFKGFRDDKNAKECTFESIFGN